MTPHQWWFAFPLADGPTYIDERLLLRGAAAGHSGSSSPIRSALIGAVKSLE